MSMVVVNLIFNYLKIVFYKWFIKLFNIVEVVMEWD
jgi:hypothetical protein